MIDIGIITGSGVYELLQDAGMHRVETRFGTAEVAVGRVGPWVVGSIPRHQRGHAHLPHTIPHRANLTALKQLGARAVLATTVVGAVDPHIRLGRPVVFDDLFFPANDLPGSGACTVYTEPGEPGRGHLVWSESLAPRLRRKLEQAAENLEFEPHSGGIYGHTNGPRFETRAEIQWLASAGVTAVSQTCGPEAVLAGELEIPYALVGFPVNYATGVAPPESEEDLERLITLSANVLPSLVLRTAEMLVAEDMVFEYGYVYRFDNEVVQDGT